VDNQDNALFLDEDMLNTLLSLDEFKGLFLDELIDIYVTSTPHVLQRLINAIEANKVEESIRVAHKLKGMCGNLGVLQLVTILTKIEVSFSELSDVTKNSLPAELKKEHHRSIALLNDHWHSQKKKIA
jgi:HPt (histidine-containing phosphotransfer) domain-containing protein